MKKLTAAAAMYIGEKFIRIPFVCEKEREREGLLKDKEGSSIFKSPVTH